MTFASPFVATLPYFADTVVECGLPQLQPMAVNSNEHPPVVFACLVLLKGQGFRGSICLKKFTVPFKLAHGSWCYDAVAKHIESVSARLVHGCTERENKTLGVNILAHVKDPYVVN